MAFQLWKQTSCLLQPRKMGHTTEQTLLTRAKSLEFLVTHPSSAAAPQGRGFLSPSTRALHSPTSHPRCGLISEPPVAFLQGFASPARTRSSHWGRRKGLHASFTGLIYTEKAKLLKEGDVCTKVRPVAFFWSTVTHLRAARFCSYYMVCTWWSSSYYSAFASIWS